MTAIFTMWLSVSLAAAAVGTRVVPEASEGVVAGAFFVVLLVLTTVTPRRLLPFTEDPLVTSWWIRFGWPAVIAAGALLMFVLASRDPARPRR
jgi:hypothetical protein